MDKLVNPEYKNLINSLVKDGYLKTLEIIEAFKAIDRKDFIPDEQKESAYVNTPLPIGFGQTISQPLTVAFMMELLKPKAGEKIMDIGAGSGWTLALLAQIVGGPPVGGGRIIGIERIPELKKMAENNVAKYGFIRRGIVEIIFGDGSRGYEKEAHYDKIIAAASAEGKIPEEWQRQLKIGGRIVAPVGNSIIAIDKIGKDKYNIKEYFGFSFVPLIKVKD